MNARYEINMIQLHHGGAILRTFTTYHSKYVFILCQTKIIVNILIDISSYPNNWK